MKRTMSAGAFRNFDRMQDTLARAAMPRTAAADPAPVFSTSIVATTRQMASVGGLRLVAPPTFKLAEVARG